MFELYHSKCMCTQHTHHRSPGIAHRVRIVQVGGMHQIPHRPYPRPARVVCVPNATATTQSSPVIPYVPHNKPRIEAQPGQPPIIILPGFGNCSEDYTAPFGDAPSSVVTALQVSLTKERHEAPATTPPHTHSYAAFQSLCPRSSAPTGSTSHAACSRPAFGQHPVPPTRFEQIHTHMHAIQYRRRVNVWSLLGTHTTTQGYRWYLDRVHAAVESARRVTDSETVDLVGHSAGGWLARAYLADPKCVIAC